jgi:hypothetical protein
MNPGDEEADENLFDVSDVAGMSDVELTERRRRLLHVERGRFHDNLTNGGFVVHVAHWVDSDLDDARRMVEKEMKRRGLWPTRDET